MTVHMRPLRSAVTSTAVQGKTLMTEHARQNKTYRYDNENLSKVDNRGIRAGWRHCSRLLNNDFGQVFSISKPETRMLS